MTRSNQPLDAFLSDLASRAPTPGGGSASALVGAVASALCAMVGRLNDRKDGTHGALHDTIAAADELRSRLTLLIEEDIAAFNELAASWKLPDDNPADLAKKQAAVVRATRSPLAIMEQSAAVMRLALEGMERSKKNCLSDAACAGICAHAALKAARLNVMINLPGIRDESLRTELRRRADRMVEEAQRTAGSIEALIASNYD